MKKFFRILPVLIAASALIPECVRLFRVWTRSPLDRFDGFYFAGGILLAAGILLTGHNEENGKERTKRKKQGFAFVALVPMAFFIASGSFALYRSVYVPLDLSLLGFLASSVWFVFGWGLFFRLIPAFFVAALSIPTSSLLTVVPGWFLTPWPWSKLALAGIAVLFVLRDALIHPKIPSVGTGMYHICLAFFFLTLFFRIPSGAPDGDAFFIDSGKLQFRNFVASEILPSEEDLRFFAGSPGIRRRNYFDPDDRSISLLEVESGKSVHQIHPAEVCLLSSGAEVTAREERSVLFGGTPLAVESIRYRRQGKNYLCRVWYTNETLSTGSYVRFRRLWRNGSRWKIYQLATPVAATYEDAEELLNGFLSAMRADGARTLNTTETWYEQNH